MAYISISICLFSRHFTEADGVIAAEALGMAAKPVSMFDPTLIELQKKYAKDLLTHYNPYTKLRYCDDPAVALIEIINESSIIGLKPENLPDFYSSQFTNLFNDWKKKSPFNNEKRAFAIYLEKEYYKNIISYLQDNLNIRIPIGGSQFSPIESLQICDFIDSHVYFDHPKFSNKKWDKNFFTIHNRSIFKDKNLGIINLLRNREKEAQKTNKPFTVTEWNHCYPNIYAYEDTSTTSSNCFRR